jgi:diacylglycerol kinase (ATP)
VIAAIVNPRAGGGSGHGRWRAVARSIQARLGPVEVFFTERPGHATLLAREIAARGCGLLLVAGGDGTLNEAVNGLVPGGPSGLRLGVLPLGSGGDFARTLGVCGLDAAVAVLAEGATHRVDVFYARFRAPGGAAGRYFLNVASFGLGGLVAAGTGGWRRLLPGTARYLAAAIPPLAAGRAFNVRVTLDGDPPATWNLTTAAIANGQYQGGGIRIAPEASLADGLADVTVVERVSLGEVIANLPILYNGAIYTYPKVRHWRAARIRAEADTEVPLELDGEVVGTLPAEFEVIPQAIRLVGLPGGGAPVSPRQ